MWFIADGDGFTLRRRRTQISQIWNENLFEFRSPYGDKE